MVSGSGLKAQLRIALASGYTELSFRGAQHEIKPLLLVAQREKIQGHSGASPSARA